ncbi:MAG: RNA polymerase sigma factor [Ruminococcus sp.]
MNIVSSNIALYAFEHFGNTVLRAAFSHTGNMSEAEDITQDVFLSLHLNPVRFNGDEHLKAWLLRAAVNRCRNYHKSRRVRGRIALDDIGEDKLSYPFSNEETELLEVVMSLPEKYSSVIHLYYYEGYSIREIADILEKNENTVSSLLQRARKKMKIQLEEEDSYEEKRLQKRT